MGLAVKNKTLKLPIVRFFGRVALEKEAGGCPIAAVGPTSKRDAAEVLGPQERGLGSNPKPHTPNPKPQILRV